MSYQVRLTNAAQVDYEQRLIALAHRSPDAARKLHASYSNALERLSEFPHSGGLAYENSRFREELRHLLFWASPRRKYRLLYTIQHHEVVILAIRAPGEQPADIENLE